MRDIVKKVILEQTQEKFKVGCNNFPLSSIDYKWCKFAESKLSKSLSKPIEAIEKFKNELMSGWSEDLKLGRYDKEHIFFSERRVDVLDAMKKFKAQCPRLYDFIFNEMLKFKESFVILNKEDKYDPINKLNTNWSALAYIMTYSIPDEFKTVDWKKASDYFFETKDLDGVTPFEKFLGGISTDRMKEIAIKVYKTIEFTTNEGQKIEDEFYNYISQFVGVKQYAGDYSFMDMMGIDMVIENPDGEWIPVQVKKYAGGCDSPKKYRNHMCENWCVSYEKDYWKIRTYNGGGAPKKIHEQPKNERLNPTTFLNTHIDDIRHD